MMAGLAIVATDVGDTAVAIEHEKTGLLIPPKDEAALTTALRRLITDPALRQRLGAAAREKALAEFSLDAMARRVLEELGQHSTSAAANPVPA
jgi:glycosyltransferase involved in cell wall biosynthesis